MDKIALHVFTQGQAAAPPLAPWQAVPVIYAAGENGRLYRLRAARPPYGEIMAIRVDTGTGILSPQAFALSAAAECLAQRFRSIVIMAPEHPSETHAALARATAAAAASRGITLFLPESLAGGCENARVMIRADRVCFPEALQVAVASVGAQRVSLELRAVRKSVSELTDGWETRLISESELSAALGHSRALGYSAPLLLRCAAASGAPEYVFYDDMRSISDKLALAQTLGVRDAFIGYSDLLGVMRVSEI